MTLLGQPGSLLENDYLWIIEDNAWYSDPTHK